MPKNVREKATNEFRSNALTLKAVSHMIRFMNADMRQTLSVNLLSLSEAAEQFAVSRRTLERWVRDGRLAARPSVGDKRRRLVDPEAVAILVRQMPKPTFQHHTSEATTDSGSRKEQREVGEEPTLEIDYNQTIDDVLQLMYSHYHRFMSQLHPESFRELTLDELREGPLGRDLRRLGAVALGQAHEPKDLVLAAIDAILQILFWPAAAEDYAIPRDFWDSETGRMLSLAKYRAYKPHELISIGATAELLGVTRPTIYRWMDDRTLNYVRDDISGRTFVVRRDVVNLKRVATELAAQQAMLESAFAS